MTEEMKQDKTLPMHRPLGTVTKILEFPGKMETKEVIPNLLKKGEIFCLSGPSKTGKGMSLLSLALALGAGKTWLTHRCRKSRVLYMNFDLDPYFVEGRVKALGRAMKGAGTIFDLCRNQVFTGFYKGRSTTLELLREKILYMVKEHKIDVIILDPITKIMGTMVEEEMCKALKDLAYESGTAIVYDVDTELCDERSVLELRADVLLAFTKNYPKWVGAAYEDKKGTPVKARGGQDNLWALQYYVSNAEKPPDVYVYFEYPLHQLFYALEPRTAKAQ